MEETLLARITSNPAILGGKPIIRDKRLAVEHILGILADGGTVQEILEDYDWLEPQDIQACFLYVYKKLAVESQMQEAL